MIFALLAIDTSLTFYIALQLIKLQIIGLLIMLSLRSSSYEHPERVNMTPHTMMRVILKIPL